MALCRGISLFLAVLAVLSPLHAQVLADQPYSIDSQNRLSTAVSLNGQGPFNFVLDTASSMTIMFEHVRAALDLKSAPDDAFTIYGLAHIVKAQAVIPETLHLSGAVIHRLPMGVLPDGEARTDGVIGIDALANYTVVLDRTRMRLKLLAPASKETIDYRDWDAVALMPRQLKGVKASFWYTRANFNDQRFAALLDLGAGVTILNWKAAEALGIRQRDYAYLGPPAKRLRDMLGASAPALNARINITIGTQIFLGQTVLIADTPVFDFFDMSGVPAAIIGPGLLKDNSLAIDFAGHKLFIGPKVEKTAAR